MWYLYKSKKFRHMQHYAVHFLPFCQMAAPPTTTTDVEKGAKLRMKCELLRSKCIKSISYAVEKLLCTWGVVGSLTWMQFSWVMLSKVFWGNWYTTYGLNFKTQICLCQRRFLILSNSFCRPISSKNIFNWFSLTLFVETAQKIERLLSFFMFLAVYRNVPVHGSGKMPDPDLQIITCHFALCNPASMQIRSIFLESL